MRAFKKLMAGAIATAIAATMATSAFAAELNSDGKMVLSESESYTAAGQTTVLVVPAENWVQADDQTWSITSLDDTDILYIDQWEDANSAQTAITNGLGVKLTEGTLADGDYYVLFGGNTGTAGAFAISAFKCTVSSEPEGPVLKWCDINQDGEITSKDVTSLLRHTSNIEPLSFTAEQLLVVCDVNGDDEVTSKDVTRLLRHTSNIEPIEGLE